MLILPDVDLMLFITFVTSCKTSSTGLPLLMFSEKFLMSDVLATNLMLTGLLFLLTTFPLIWV